MSTRKARLTVTVDPVLVRAGHDAVKGGHAESVSAWVGLALAERAAKDRRLRGLRAAINDYETRFGAIADDELAAQARADGRAARVVRGPAAKRRTARRDHRRRTVA